MLLRFGLEFRGSPGEDGVQVFFHMGKRSVEESILNMNFV